MNKAQEVLDVVLVASDESAEPVEPSKKPFYAPPSVVTP
jgi:hypothetical protein